MNCSHQCNWCVQFTSETFSVFQALLPSENDFVICSASTSSGELMGTVRLKCSTAEGVKGWMKEFQIKSLMTFRVLSTKPVTGQKSLYCVSNSYVVMILINGSWWACMMLWIQRYAEVVCNSDRYKFNSPGNLRRQWFCCYLSTGKSNPLDLCICIYV